MTTTVISLGGSLIAPDAGVDSVFIKNFVSLITKDSEKGNKFAIVCGGGAVARAYRDALKEIANPSLDEMDWLGISATRLNAELLKLSFGSLAENSVFSNPEVAAFSDKNILVGGGWKPGHSSDGAAVALAKTLGATTLINLSNIDYVYTDDPRKNPNATKIEKTTWTDFRKLLPTEWNPGINAPFDPIAAQMAQEINLSVIVMNGKNIENLESYLNGESFMGTTIS